MPTHGMPNERSPKRDLPAHIEQMLAALPDNAAKILRKRFALGKGKSPSLEGGAQELDSIQTMLQAIEIEQRAQMKRKHPSRLHHRRSFKQE